MVTSYSMKQALDPVRKMLVIPISFMPLLCPWLQLIRPDNIVVQRVHSWVRQLRAFPPEQDSLNNTFQHCVRKPAGRMFPGPYQLNFSMFCKHGFLLSSMNNQEQWRQPALIGYSHCSLPNDTSKSHIPHLALSF